MKGILVQPCLPYSSRGIRTVASTPFQTPSNPTSQPILPQKPHQACDRSNQPILSAQCLLFPAQPKHILFAPRLLTAQRWQTCLPQFWHPQFPLLESMSIIISTSTSMASLLHSSLRGLAQSSQCDALAKKGLVAGVATGVLAVVEELLIGEYSRCEGMDQKAWRLDCRGWMAEGMEEIGWCGWEAWSSGCGFCCAVKRRDNVRSASLLVSLLTRIDGLLTMHIRLRGTIITMALSRPGVH